MGINFIFSFKVGESNVTWFKMPWLFVECYLYRKIYEFFTGTTNLRDYDPFQNEKQRSYMERFVGFRDHLSFTVLQDNLIKNV